MQLSLFTRRAISPEDENLPKGAPTSAERAKLDARNPLPTASRKAVLSSMVNFVPLSLRNSRNPIHVCSLYSDVTSSSPRYIVYTDGGCTGTEGACASIILSDTGHVLQECVSAYKNTTNNRMEIRAILSVLEGIVVPSHIVLVSDSQYCVDSINNWIYSWHRNEWTGKKNLKNLDLWKRVWERINFHNVQMVWIRGHNGNQYNERCDHLAGMAIQKGDRNKFIDCRLA